MSYIISKFSLRNAVAILSDKTYKFNLLSFPFGIIVTSSIMSYVFAECIWKNTCKENSTKEATALFGGILIVCTTFYHFSLFSLFLTLGASFMWDLELGWCMHYIQRICLSFSKSELKHFAWMYIKS